MKKIFLLSGLLLITCWSLFAQNKQQLDSLEQELKNPALSVKEKLIVYDDLSWYYSFFDFNKARQFAYEGIDYAQKNKNKIEAVLYRNLGRAYAEYTLYDSAEVIYKKALSIAVKNNMSALESGLYSAMGDLYNLQCQYDKALMYYLKSIKMAENSGDENSMCMNLANIGTMYSNMRNYLKAEKYLLKAKKIAEEIGNKEVICNMLINLNNLYNETNRQKEGLNFILEAIEIAKEIENYGSQVTALLSASTTYQDYYHDYQKAVDYSDQALKIAEFIGSSYYIMGCHRHLAASYANLGKARLSEKHALTALNMTDSTDYNTRIAMYSILIQDYIDLNEKEKAKFTLDTLYDLMLKNSDATLLSSLADMETKYETDKKDLEISSLSAKKQFFIMMTLSCIIIIILLIATLLLLQRYQRQKQLRMKEHLAKLENEKQLIATQSVLKGEDAERERLSRELHDGLGGLLTIVKLDLGTLRQSVNTQFNEIDSTIALMDQSIEEMRRMSHSLMPESLHHFGLKSTLEDFCRKNTLIHFHFFGEERRFEQNIEINFYRIGCELINNALKHANATQINVQLITSSTKLSLTVQDNGKGFDIQKIKQGLATVRARADMLNATLNIFSNPTHGSEIIVDLELPPLS